MSGLVFCFNPLCRAEKKLREDIKTGDIICIQCGRVAEEKVITSECRNFEDSENISRTEIPNDRLYTYYHPRSRPDPSSFSLTQALIKIRELGKKLNLPKTILKSAKKILSDFDTKRKISVRHFDPFMIAVLYLACKTNGLTRTIQELSRETNIKQLDIRRMYLFLTKHLDEYRRIRSTPIAVSALVIRIGSHLKLNNRVIYLANQIAKNAVGRLEDKSSSSIASGSILMALRHEVMTGILEREIAVAASIAPSTVKNIYKLLEGMDIMP